MTKVQVVCERCGFKYLAPKCHWPIACVKCTGDAAPSWWFRENNPDSASPSGAAPHATDEAFELQLQEDAELLFSHLCEGDGEHSETLDVGLIKAAFRTLLTWAAHGPSRSASQTLTEQEHPAIQFNRWFEIGAAGEPFFPGLYSEEQLRAICWLAYKAGLRASHGSPLPSGADH